MFINHESEEIGKWSRSVLGRRPTICRIYPGGTGENHRDLQSLGRINKSEAYR